jgi:hypothetical protein
VKTVCTGLSSVAYTFRCASLGAATRFSAACQCGFAKGISEGVQGLIGYAFCELVLGSDHVMRPRIAALKTMVGGDEALASIYMQCLCGIRHIRHSTRRDQSPKASMLLGFWSEPFSAVNE